MKKMQQLKRKLAAFAALLCLMTMMPLTTWAQQIVVNVVEQKARITQYSTLYVGDVWVDGQRSFYYLYSEDLTNSESVFAAVRDGLSDFKDGTYSALVTDIIGENDELGIAVCSNPAYESTMNSEWKSADKAGLACLPNTTVISSSSEDLYETDADFAANCASNFIGVSIVNDAGVSQAISGTLGILSTSITDDVTYTVINGELVKLIDRHYDYTCEMTTVIYTKVELTTASAPILGDVNGDGNVTITDITTLVDVILTGIPQNTDTSIYDINGDGDITISDVTVLVDMILNGNGNTPQAYLTCPDDHHPHIIDLGLPSGTKWACCNVGATMPEDNGGYYSWGETEEKAIYNWASYTLCDGRVNTSQNLGSDISGTGYDVAHVKWGGAWVMPSVDRLEELLYNCTCEWTTVNGVEGVKFTSEKNGGTIFLPAAGQHWQSELRSRNLVGFYWTSSQLKYSVDDAYSLLFFANDDILDYNFRGVGFSVRPVWVP